MNLTVGPLPPAVYWRRRAIVAGGLLVVILLGLYACGGSGAPAKQNPTGLHTSTSPRVSATPPPSSHPVTTPAVSPSASLDPSGPTAPTPTVSGAAGAVPTCADKDVKVWPEITSTDPEVNRLRYGGTYNIKLNIKNTSDHACTRDVGAIPEELYIMRGKTQIWSSDKCQHDVAVGKAHDVRTFQPGVQIYAELQWSSYDITTNDCTKGSSPANVDSYQLYARVGTKLSAPVDFNISP